MYRALNEQRASGNIGGNVFGPERMAKASLESSEDEDGHMMSYQKAFIAVVNCVNEKGWLN